MMSGIRIAKDRAAGGLMAVLTWTALLLVVAMAAGLCFKASPILAHHSLADLLTADEWKPFKNSFGFFPFVAGTLWVTGIALVLALPVALLSAICLTEYAPRWVCRTVYPALDILAALPSVIYGVWGTLLVVPWVSRHVAPHFVDYSSGYTVLAASVVLPSWRHPLRDGLRAAAADNARHSHGHAALGGARHRRRGRRHVHRRILRLAAHVAHAAGGHAATVHLLPAQRPAGSGAGPRLRRRRGADAHRAGHQPCRPIYNEPIYKEQAMNTLRAIRRFAGRTAGADAASTSAAGAGFVPDAKFRHPDIRPQLSTDHLNLSIDGHQILHDVTVQMPANRITCIIGPSGCGKSTLLRSLNRLTDTVEGVRVEGRIMLGDRDVTTGTGAELIDLRRRIGLVPQRPCPLPMSVFDNVAFGCRIHGIGGRRHLQAVVEHYLREVGLWDEVSDRLHQPATRLSIGQQQRLCLARSLAVEPEYILADEATSALDPAGQQDRGGPLRASARAILHNNGYPHAAAGSAHRRPRGVRLHGQGGGAGAGRAGLPHPQHELTRNYLSGVFS